MKNIFTQHPHSLGESYWQHCGFAILFALNMLIAGLAGLIHAFLPFLFVKTGSNFLLKLMMNYIERVPPTEERVQALAQFLATKLKK